MNMKKLVFNTTIIILSVLALPAFSQIRFGVRGDIGLNNPTYKSDVLKVENTTNYSIGPSMETMLPLFVADVGVDASLLYSNNRMTVSKIDENISKKITNHYIKLPLNLKAKFGIGLHLVKMYATAGPYAAYLISGEKIDLDEAAKDIKAKSFEAGTNLGLGFEVLRIFQIGVNCGFKLTDNYKTDKPDWSDPLNGKTTCWSITGSIYL
jgi:hypothetical protein